MRLAVISFRRVRSSESARNVGKRNEGILFPPTVNAVRTTVFTISVVSPEDKAIVFQFVVNLRMAVNGLQAIF